MVKNLPTNAGVMGSIPGPEDPTCLGVAEPVSHNYGTWALEPVLCNKRRHHSEKPEHCNDRVAPAHHKWRKSPCSNEDSVQQKKKKKKKSRPGLGSHLKA